VTAGARFCASCGASVAAVCRGCGGELVPGAAFCPSCGTAQTDESAASTPEELRVVSCVFADLAGFTSHTERSDPEDVRARLSKYHARVREDVARWDGSVEKLMGDGVFAVFGVPTVHEDDPERAVRAALRIQQSVSELNSANPGLDLSVRIGVTTGEAIIQLDARDQSERIIGDVVNTASRLEGVAPAGGVIIDERTYRSVRSTIRCDALDPVAVKGKAAPLMVWRAVEARSRYGVAVAEDETASLVGRQEELSLLLDALDRTVARRSPQLVTISGEPGVGKSRLVREFWAVVDHRPDLVVRWRQGRSLPYGAGVTFWALSEIVKSEAGTTVAFEAMAGSKIGSFDAGVGPATIGDLVRVDRAVTDAWAGRNHDADVLRGELEPACPHRPVGSSRASQSRTTVQGSDRAFSGSTRARIRSPSELTSKVSPATLRSLRLKRGSGIPNRGEPEEKSTGTAVSSIEPPLM